jgi:hypothetical protein
MNRIKINWFRPEFPLNDGTLPHCLGLYPRIINSVTAPDIKMHVTSCLYYDTPCSF